ncbi:SGNH/GDSL hydrolase family protein [Sinorhizobium chiapasense]
MVLNAATVWRDYKTDGIPSSGPHKIKKSEIRTWGGDLENSVYALTLSTNAAVVRSTKAELDAVVGNFADGDIGLAVTDPTIALRGVYEKTGGVWVKQSDLPTDVAQIAANAAEAAQAGAETAQDGAEAARDLVEGWAGDIVSQGNVPIYGTVSGISALTIPVGINFIRLNGYASVGDKGDWPLVKEITEDGSPVLPGQVRSNSNTRRWELIADEAVPEMFGSVANNTGIDNSAALVAWRDYCNRTGSKPKLPRGRIYNVASSPSLGGPGVFIIDAEPGSGFRGPFVVNPNIRARGAEFTLNYVGTDVYQYVMSPAYQSDMTSRRIWLDAEGGLDRSTVRAVDCTTEPEHLTLAYPGGDTYSASTASNVTADSFTRSLANDGLMRLSLLPAEPAAELSVYMDDVGSVFNRIAHLRTSKGYVQLRANGDSGFTIEEKLIGAAVTSSSTLWVGQPFHTAYSPVNAMWTLRNYDGRTVGLLLNGREIARYKAAGFVTHWGFGGLATASIQIAIRNWAIRRNIAVPYGIPALKVATFGDSFTAPIQGDWPTYMRQVLEGALSASAKVDNLAVNGANSDGVLSQITAYDKTGLTDAVIMVSVNDQQASVSAATLRARLISSIDALQVVGARVYIVLQTPYYDKTLANGVNASNMNGAGKYRSYVQRVAAEKGCVVIDTMQQLKPALATMLSDGSLDPGLRDNLHPTAFAYMLIGRMVARAILAGASAKITKLMPPQDLPTWALASSWTLGTPAGSAEMNGDGIARLSGRLVPSGTKTAGTVILNLPAPLRPVKAQHFIVRSELASVLLDIATTGAITLRTNMTGMSDTWVSLDGISFATAASA